MEQGLRAIIITFGIIKCVVFPGSYGSSGGIGSDHR